MKCFSFSDRPVPHYIPQPYPVVKHVPVEVKVPVLVSRSLYDEEVLEFHFKRKLKALNRLR